MTLVMTTHPSPVGPLRLVADAQAEALVAVLWPEEAPGRVKFVSEPLDSTPTAGTGDPISDGSAVLGAASVQLDEYFAGERTRFELDLAPRGTEFQLQVWRSLAEIPYGETSSYGKQAAAIGRPSAVRAVGAANGRNPLSIVLPCHRIVGADGKLTGFAGGIETKRWLLDHERNHRR